MESLDINLTTDDVLWTNLLHGLGNGLSYTPLAFLTFSTLPVRLVTQGSESCCMYSSPRRSAGNPA